MDNQLTITPEVRTFLEGLLKDSGMTTLNDEMKEEMIKELYARLDNFMTSVLIDSLPPEHLETFIKMNEEKKSQPEVEAFLKEKVPNAAEILAKAFMDFREEYLGNVTTYRNAPQPQNQTAQSTPLDSQVN